MTNNQFPDSGVFIPAGQLVKTGQPYLVQCTGFACQAVLTKAGHWKDFSTGKELPDVINVFATH